MFDPAYRSLSGLSDFTEPLKAQPETSNNKHKFNKDRFRCTFSISVNLS